METMARVYPILIYALGSTLLHCWAAYGEAVALRQLMSMMSICL